MKVEFDDVLAVIEEQIQMVRVVEQDRASREEWSHAARYQERRMELLSLRGLMSERFNNGCAEDTNHPATVARIRGLLLQKARLYQTDDGKPGPLSQGWDWCTITIAEHLRKIAEGIGG